MDRSRFIRILSFLVLSMGLAPVTALADHCSAGQLEGFVTITRTTFTPLPASCTEWFRTGSPTFLNRGLGLWQRACRFRKTDVIETSKKCYASRWDRFWNLRGRRTALVRSQVRRSVVERSETRVCTTAATPSDDLPPEDKQLWGATSSSISADPVSTSRTFGNAEEILAFATYPDPVPYADILNDLGEGFATVSTQIGDLGPIIDELDDPENQLAALQQAIGGLDQSLASVAQTLQSAMPPNPAPFVNLAQAFAMLQNVFQNGTGLRSYRSASSHLVAGIALAQQAAILAQGNLDEDLEQLSFLALLNGVGVAISEAGIGLAANQPFTLNEIGDENQTRPFLAYSNPIIPHFVTGDGNRFRLVVNNTGSRTDTGLIRFFDTAGAEVAVNIGGEPTTVIPFQIEPGSSLAMETDGDEDLFSGFVRISSDLYEESRLNASGIFDLLGCFISIDNAPLSNTYQFFVPFQPAGENPEIAGVAIQNPDPENALQLDLFLRDQQGILVASGELALDPGQQVARFIDDEDLFGAFFSNMPSGASGEGAFRGRLQIMARDGRLFTAVSLVQRFPSGALFSVAGSQEPFFPDLEEEGSPE